MKEAAGEANMTVITIVLIAIVLAVGTAIVNNLTSTAKRRACCQSLGGIVNGNLCTVKNAGAIMDDSWVDAVCPED